MLIVIVLNNRVLNVLKCRIILRVWILIIETWYNPKVPKIY
jgi:hypothetical protein